MADSTIHLIAVAIGEDWCRSRPPSARPPPRGSLAPTWRRQAGSGRIGYEGLGSRERVGGIESEQVLEPSSAHFPVLRSAPFPRAASLALWLHHAGASRAWLQDGVLPGRMIQINTAAQLSQKVLHGIKTAFHHRTGCDCGYRSQRGRTRLRRVRHLGRTM